MYTSLRITSQRGDLTKTTLIPKNTLVDVINKQTKVKGKDLKTGDILKENWVIINIEKDRTIVDKWEDIDRLAEFYQEGLKLFQDRPWSVVGLEELLQKYEIFCMRNVYAGLQIINEYGEDLYVSGDLIETDYKKR